MKIEYDNIYCEDVLDILKQMRADFVDIVITSPPYNIGTDFGTDKDTKYLHSSDSMSDEYYTDWLCDVINNLLRVTRKYIFFNIQFNPSTRYVISKIFDKYDDSLKDIMIWAKTNPPPSISKFCTMRGFEFIFVLERNTENKSFNKDKNVKRIFSNTFIEPVNYNDYSDIHSAVFPDWLPEEIIKNFSDEGDVILDCFNGVGTTTYYAKDQKRKYIGIDNCEEYCKVARERLKDLEKENFEGEVGEFF